jgi:hypothetical protein
MMKKILCAGMIALCAAWAVSAQAQTACTNLNQAQLLNSFADTAPAGSITPHTMRNLVCSSALVDSGGNLTTAGTVSGATLNAVGALTAATATVAGTLAAASANVTGNVNAATMALTGTLTSPSATLTGALVSASATVSGALTAGSATVTGALTLGSLSMTGASIDGSGNAVALSLVTGTINAPTTTAINFGNATHGAGMQLADSGGTTVNELIVTPSATGTTVKIAAGGSGADTNLALTIASRGTGALVFDTNATVQQFGITHTASAVDYLSVTGGAAGSPGVIPLTATGTDSAITLALQAKGTGAVALQTAGGTLQFNVSNTASAVDYLNATGSATGSPGHVTLSALGSDTDVGIIITPKGAGVLRLGNSASFTANNTVGTTMTSLGPTGSHTTVQEWLTVEDSAGTVRYIPAY